jgi:stress-induced-phosphoprotein 1
MGLEIEPDNSSLKEGLTEVEEAMFSGKNPFGQLFGPDIWAKIQTNPRLSPYLSDPSFVQKVQLLQKNPSMISGMLNDPKIQVCDLRPPDRFLPTQSTGAVRIVAWNRR